MSSLRIVTDDTQLLDDLKEGKSSAYTEVYKKYFKMCRVFVSNNNGKDEDAEDIFQEAMIALINNLRKPGFKLTAKLSTYLYSIIRQLWLYKLRSKKQTIELKENRSNFVDLGDKEIQEKQDFEERHHLVKNMLENISEECRKLIVDYYYKNLKLKDIGRDMNYSGSFVKVKKHRCMDGFIKKIKAQPEYQKLRS